jgi:hypothetical protein
MKMIFMIVNKQKLVLDIFLNLLERISTLFQNKVIFLSLNKRTSILLQSLFFYRVLQSHFELYNYTLNFHCH